MVKVVDLHNFHMDSLWIEVVVCEFQCVVIAELSQDGPGGLVSSSLNKKCVQKKET